MRVLLMLLMLLFLTNCDNNEFVLMTYSETACSDAWRSYEMNTTTEVAVINYFREELGVEIEDINIKVIFNDPFCYACSCATGREIQVWVDEKYVHTLEAEGFIRA